MTDPHDPMGPNGPNPGPGQQYPNQGPGQNYPTQGQQYPNQGQQYPNQGQQYPNQGQQYPNQGPGQNYPDQGQNYPNQGPGQNYPDQGQNYPNQGQQYAGQGGPGYPVSEPPAATPEKKGTGGLVATIIVMLLVGGAIGFFAGPKVLDKDDDTSTDTAAAVTTTAAPAADPSVWAEHYGTFEVSLPEGNTVTSDKALAGQYMLNSFPGTGTTLYDGGGVTVNFDRRPDMTPEKELDEVGPSKKCTTPDGERAPYTNGEFTGVAEHYTGCPNGFELTRVVVAVPGGTNLLIAVAHKPGEAEAAITKVLDSFVAGAKPDTQVAPLAGCPDIEDSPKPDWPLSLQVKNHTDADVSFGWVDPATGEVTVDPDPLAPGYTTATRYTKPGDKFRVTANGTDTDYTATSEKYQCVVFNETGFETVSS